MMAKRADFGNIPERKARGRLFRGVVAVGGVVLAFAILELIGAILLQVATDHPPDLPAEFEGIVLTSGRSPRTRRDPYLLFRVKPDQSEEHYSTNSHGLRGAEIEPRPADGVFRVLRLGGSVAWGYTAWSNEENPAAVLEDYLDRRAREGDTALAGRDVEVLNGGAPGYVSWQEALVYTIYLRDLRPHAVVFLDGVNEIYASIRHRRAGFPMSYRAAGPRSEEPTLGNWLHHQFKRMRLRKFLQKRSTATLLQRSPPAPAEEVALAYIAARWSTPATSLVSMEPSCCRSFSRCPY